LRRWMTGIPWTRHPTGKRQLICTSFREYNVFRRFWWQSIRGNGCFNLVTETKTFMKLIYDCTFSRKCFIVPDFESFAIIRLGFSRATYTTINSVFRSWNELNSSRLSSLRLFFWSNWELIRCSRIPICQWSSFRFQDDFNPIY
jgi:hypothetical protein